MNRLALILWPIVRPVLIRAGRGLRDRWADELRAEPKASKAKRKRSHPADTAVMIGTLALIAGLAIITTAPMLGCRQARGLYVRAWDLLDPDRPADGEPGPGIPEGVTWLHTNVSAWPATSELRAVHISGSSITLDYDAADRWPGRDHVGAHVNANPWIFVERDGRWYAATWEWMRRGQTTKALAAVNGDHIKRAPLHDFQPRSGERYYFMVSGLARDHVRNARERTNLVEITWP